MHCIQQYCNYLPVNKAFIISYYSSSGAIFTHAPLSSYVSSRQTFPYYYNCLMASFFRTTWVSQYQKGKTSLDLNEAKEDGDDSGISWTICKQSAPHSQQTTTPTHHWIFYRPHALSDAQATESTEGLYCAQSPVPSQKKHLRIARLQFLRDECLSCHWHDCRA